MTEKIDGPAHYRGKDDPYEAIKVMLAWHGPVPTAWFCRLNAEKYLCRSGAKEVNPVDDLRKAAWYAKAAADILEHGQVRP